MDLLSLKTKKRKFDGHNTNEAEKLQNYEPSEWQFNEEQKKKKKKKNESSDDDKVLENSNSDENIEQIEILDDKLEKKKLKKLRKEAKQLKRLQKQEEESGGEFRNLSNMSTEEITDFRKIHNIQVFPEEESMELVPITEFAKLYPYLQSNCPYIIDYLKMKNFKTPSPIQAQCWLPLLKGRDVIGIATTGSGKTLTFLIPALLKIEKMGPQFKEKGSVPTPRILIVSPTRELALQSHEVAVEIGGPLSVCVYGGVSKHSQKAELRCGAEVVVATPGRLLDLVDERALSLEKVVYLVLDEADRMLDAGFEPDVRRLAAQCPRGARQTLLFSATWPEEIRALAGSFLRPNFVRVVVGGAQLCASHRVTQIVECVDTHRKNARLLELMALYHGSRRNRCLVFVLYKREAVTLLTFLQGKGYNATAIHGDRGQQERTAALESFKKGETPLLIATDVAARGLDIPQVEYVINYSFPLTVEDYVHRIGRTGRAGATGVAHTFFCDCDKTLAGALVAVLREAGQEVPSDMLKYSLVTKKKQSKMYGDFGPKVDLVGKKATKIVFDE